VYVAAAVVRDAVDVAALQAEHPVKAAVVGDDGQLAKKPESTRDGSLASACTVKKIDE
jgi:hypothetical protein